MQFGEAPTTTAAPTTTTVAPTTATTKAPARKAPATTAAVRTRPKPSSTTRPTQAVTADRAETLEAKLLRPGNNWLQLDDDEFGTGPADIDKAAADAAEDESQASIDAERRFLESIRFEAGFSRMWVEGRPDDDNLDDETVLYVSLSYLGATNGASEYQKRDAAKLEATFEGRQVTRFQADIPGSQGWAFGDDENGYSGVVIFAKGNVYAQVVCFRPTTDANTTHRAWAQMFAEGQYKSL